MNDQASYVASIAALYAELPDTPCPSGKAAYAVHGTYFHQK